MRNNMLISIICVWLFLQATHYETLNVAITATTSEIRKAYLKKAHKLHPDRNPHTNTTRLFQELSEAFTTLKDPALRAAYDESLAHENIYHTVSCSTYINQFTQWTTIYLTSCLCSDNA